ncbi:porin family protein [Vibrio sp. CK2-1]|uniref:porin family protein n=1 Tax=Vibrio sp. CK2-1 TaxID=2912249 RepID=UPI001F24AB11|nr:porin family protein [Vibrio sp. CK2-1]MCF7354691.1 porin family protein [Vibrio sp. CK2-1]
MKNLKLALCLLGTTLPIAAPTLAADADTTNRDFSGFYLGAGYGKSYFSDGDLGKDSPNYIQGNKVDFDIDTDDNNYQIYGGYYFNRIVGIEANYIDYGNIDTKEKYTGTKNSTSVKSASVAANIGYTFDSGIRIFALPGLAYIDSDASKDNVGFHFGTGVEYTPNAVPHLTLRAIYQGDVYFTDEKDNDGDNYTFVSSSFALGAAYRF